jgi:hypothetical protein
MYLFCSNLLLHSRQEKREQNRNKEQITMTSGGPIHSPQPHSLLHPESVTCALHKEKKCDLTANYQNVHNPWTSLEQIVA